MLGSSSIDVSTLLMKILQTKGEIFCDQGDRQNMVKVKPMTRNERSSNYASWV